MQQRTYRGPIKARDLAEALVSRFNDGSLYAQATGQDDHMIVQIVARERRKNARNALTIAIIQHEDAVEVSLGEHRWLGNAADIAQAALLGWFNPFTLLGQIAEIADDVQALQLPAEVWEAVEHYASSVNAKLGLAEETRMVACPFCGVGNPVGDGQCDACGGSLAQVQPRSCPQCGKTVTQNAIFCLRCGAHLG